jgi:TPR repeat protein
MSLEETLLDMPVQESSGQEENDGQGELDALIQLAQTDSTAMTKLGLRYQNGDGVEKNPGEALKWFEKAGDSIALYAAGGLCAEQGNFKKAEEYLLRGMEAPDGLARSFICGELGQLYFTGFYGTETPDYEKAIAYFKQQIQLDPAQGHRSVLQLAQAYRNRENYFQAIHWYKKGMSEYGIAECEDELWDLYLTGVGGEDLKKQAKARMERKAQEAGETAKETDAETAGEQQKPEQMSEESREEQAPEQAPPLEWDRTEYPRSFTDKMEQLLALEMQIRSIPEEAEVPMRKRGLFSNKAEVERIEADNARLRQQKENDMARYKQIKKELAEEKTKLGTDREFFFDIPQVANGGDPYYIKNKYYQDVGGHSLYTGYLNSHVPLFMDWQGYHCDTDQWQLAKTYVNDELNFYMCDVQGKLVDKNQAGTGEKGLYLGHHRKGHSISLDVLRTLMESDRYIRLFYDWKYIEAHRNDTYTVNYLWDRNIDEWEYDLPTDHVPDAESMIQRYSGYCPELTVLNMLPYGEFRSYILDNDRDSCCGDWLRRMEIGGWHILRFMKKAAIVWSNQKVRAILLPKTSSPVVKMLIGCIPSGDKAWSSIRYERIEGPQNGKINFQVLDLAFETGSNLAFQNASTVALACACLKEDMPRFDATMERPKELPYELWRLWIQLYYAQDVKNRKC